MTRSLLDLSEDATYRRLAACLSATNTGQVAVFRPQPGGVPAAWPVERTASIAASAGHRAGLVPEAITVVERDVYAAFRRSGSERAVTTTAGTGASSEGAAGIEVMQATYGSNCGAGWGNATPDVANACNRTQECDYQVDVRRLGDPAIGCAKQFVVEYRCSGGQPSKRVTVAAEAGLGGIASLGCP
jgi:hypothetical protein